MLFFLTLIGTAVGFGIVMGLLGRLEFKIKTRKKKEPIIRKELTEDEYESDLFI